MPRKRDRETERERREKILRKKDRETEVERKCDYIMRVLNYSAFDLRVICILFGDERMACAQDSGQSILVILKVPAQRTKSVKL